MKKKISRLLKKKKRANRRATKNQVVLEIVKNANKPPEGCGKVKYHTELAAKMALSKCINGKSGKRAERNYYFCKQCNAYHLTKRG